MVCLCGFLFVGVVWGFFVRFFVLFCLGGDLFLNFKSISVIIRSTMTLSFYFFGANLLAVFSRRKY